ncbi:unnamed protein product [Rhodiola kirilowii]
MSTLQFGFNSTKSYTGYSKGDFDIELGSFRRPKRPKASILNPTRMLKSLLNKLRHFYNKHHPLLLFIILLSLGVTIVLILSLYRSNYQLLREYEMIKVDLNYYPFAKLKNLVMVAGYSVYTSNSCGKADEEGSWFLESYQKHPGQAATFLAHIRKAVEVTTRDNDALLLFSGGETRNDAGTRSKAQSYEPISKNCPTVTTVALRIHIEPP